MKEDNHLIFGPLVCISIAVVVIVIVVAFSSFFRCLWWCLVHYIVNWLIVHTGIYGIWRRMPDKMRGESMIKWAETEVEKMKNKVKSEIKQKRTEANERKRQERLDQAKAGSNSED